MLPDGGLVLPGGDKEAAYAIATYLEMRELPAQFLRRNGIQLEEFLVGALPHCRRFWFVPYLPILYAVVKAIGPAVVVVPDYVAAYLRPFMKILWRLHPVRMQLVIVLNGDAQAVEWHQVRGMQSPEIGVGVIKVVGGRIIHIRIKVRKYIWHIHKMRTAKGTASIMKAHVGYSSRLQFRQFLVVEYRRVVDAVQRLYLPYNLLKICFYATHDTPFFLIRRLTRTITD